MPFIKNTFTQAVRRMIVGVSMLAFGSAAQAQGFQAIPLQGTALGTKSGSSLEGLSVGTGSLASAPTRSENQVYDRSLEPQAWSHQGIAMPREVGFSGPHKAGEVFIDHKNQYLYVVLPNQRALEVVIGVGRDGRAIKHKNLEIVFKEVDPMLIGNDGEPVPMKRGPANALGVRGMYLATAGTKNYEGYVMHGTNAPAKLTAPDGQRRISSGCFRMQNDDVMKVYSLVKVGTKVTVYHNNEMAPYLARGTRNVAQQELKP